MNITTETGDVNTDEREATGACAVTSVVVRLAGELRPRIDLTHAGTREQQLGVSVGTALVYMRAAVTAEAVASGWATAAPYVRSLLQPATPGGRAAMRTVIAGPVGVLVRLGGVPRLVAAPQPARGPVPAMVRIQSGPIVWEVLDLTAYSSMLATWRRAVALLAAVEEPGKGRGR